MLWKGLLRNEDAYIAAVDTINAAFADWPAITRSGRRPSRTDVKASVEGSVRQGPQYRSRRQVARTVLEANFAKLEEAPAMPDAVTKALDGYVAQLTLVQRVIDRVYDFVGKGDQITIDWSTARSAALPDLYTATGIREAAFGASPQDRFHAERRAESRSDCR